MEKRKADIDIVNEVLEACILAYPVSSFVISIYKQYLERGSLSKKQLEGLYGKAKKIEGLPPGKLATLEALIKKMATRFKTQVPENAPLYIKDEVAGEMISSILSKYPGHKQVLFLKSKYDNHEILTATELADLKRIYQYLKTKI